MRVSKIVTFFTSYTFLTTVLVSQTLFYIYKKYLKKYTLLA